MKKRTEVTIELDEIVLVRSVSRASLAWCDLCANEVVMVTPEQAAVIARVSVRTINRLVEAGLVHFTETPAGSLLVCPNSLG